MLLLKVSFSSNNSLRINLNSHTSLKVLRTQHLLTFREKINKEDLKLAVVSQTSKNLQ